MSTLVTGTIKSNTANPPLFQNTSGTEIGTLCRAWVNFNGTGTVAIRASYNVSSITDNGTGDYTVNFATAMVDANYSLTGTVGVSGSTAALQPETFSTGAIQIKTTFNNASSVFAADFTLVSVSIFR